MVIYQKKKYIRRIVGSMLKEEFMSIFHTRPKACSSFQHVVGRSKLVFLYRVAS
jgi:hypothetical protein